MSQSFNALEYDLSILKAELEMGQATLLDIREQREYFEHHVKTAKFYPLSELEDLSETSIAQFLKPYQGQKLYIHCRSGARACRFCEKLLPYAQRSDIELIPLKYSSHDLKQFLI